MKNNGKSISILLTLLFAIFYLTISTGASNKEQLIQPQKNLTSIPGELTKSILFVGNSLTYINDLPSLVAKVGRENGIKIKTTMIAYANYALEDHWKDGKLQVLIANNKYDFVVVQQGPSSQSDGRAMLMDYGAKIKNICIPHNTKLAFFMVWPAYSNFNNFDGVISNYTNAALSSNSLLCPVGKIWKDHFLETGDYTYYGPDMFHPSQKGSQIAAQIIFKTLFK